MTLQINLPTLKQIETSIDGIQVKDPLAEDPHLQSRYSRLLLAMDHILAYKTVPYMDFDLSPTSGKPPLPWIKRWTLRELRIDRRRCRISNIKADFLTYYKEEYMPKRITLENSLAQTWMQGTEEGHVALKGMLDALDNEMIDRKLEGEREIMKLTLEIERVLSSSL